jgi:hypothetical protein
VENYATQLPIEHPGGYVARPRHGIAGFDVFTRFTDRRT